MIGCQVKVNVLTCDYIDFYFHMRYLLSFVVSYHLFVFFNNANTVSAEMWVWGFGNHAWYKSLVKSLVFDSWLETFVSLVISKTPYSHFLLTVFSQYILPWRPNLSKNSKKCNLHSSFYSSTYLGYITLEGTLPDSWILSKREHMKWVSLYLIF